MLQTIFLSSLHKVSPAQCPSSPITSLSGFQNEPVSCQVAFRLAPGKEKTLPIYARVESDLPVSLYFVGYVPVIHTDVGLPNAPAPGLIGDMLLPKRLNPPIAHEGFPWGKRYFEEDRVTLNAANDSWQALWLIVNEDGKNAAPGSHTLCVRFFSGINGQQIGECDLEISIIAAFLPEQRIKYTNWFHYDCLSDFYNVDMFSDAFFAIMKNFVSVAVKNGMNMLLLPAFTPPLDTPIFSRRKTAQLVKIFYENGQYNFDFSLMKKFLDLCRAAGIEYFEHSHLFTQWGAQAAPQIVASVEGEKQEIFGWQTDAVGPEYKAFLHAYLPALRAFLHQEGLEEKVLFHISDEPSEENASCYRRALETVCGLLDGLMAGDALSHYSFYQQGLVKIPIVVTSSIADFAGQCDHLWCYYTGGQIQNGLSNRLLVSPPAFNRMIGVQMYVYRIEGFLHWAYNYYYDTLSHGLFDPKINPCGYNNHPGTTYSVYPAQDGSAIQSTRQKVFFEGLLDVRALELLEKLCGRSACEALIRKFFGRVTFYTTPQSPEHFLTFRKALNEAVQQASDQA